MKNLIIYGEANINRPRLMPCTCPKCLKKALEKKDPQEYKYYD